MHKLFLFWPGILGVGWRRWCVSVSSETWFLHDVVLWCMIGPVKQLPPGNGGARRKRKRVQDLSSDEESGIKHVCVLLLCWKRNVSCMLTADETGGAQMPKSDTSPPKRRKKLVTKMYVDDEGAMGELFSTVYHKITICYLDLDSSKTFSA